MNDRSAPELISIGDPPIRSFAFARQVLKSSCVRQGGFNAKFVSRLPLRNLSILFAHGEVHRKQRGALARFFAPAAVARYRASMVDIATELVGGMAPGRRVCLDEMSLEMTVAVAAQIVGLDYRARPGLGRRLSRFFNVEPRGTTKIAVAVYVARSLLALGMIYLLDVRPAIRRRRRVPQDDVLSHLIDSQSSTLDMLTECVTYATAGISTTREFITLAGWQLFEDKKLREVFLATNEAGRCALLEELLARRPVIDTLYRNVALACELQSGEERVALEAGALLTIDVRAVNNDPSAFGCPVAADKQTANRRHMSFGDGPHKCPGAAVALLESAVFLETLLRMPGIKLVQKPSIDRNTMIAGCVLRDAFVSIGSTLA